MEKEQIHVTVEKETNELVVLHGEAPESRPLFRKKINFRGTLSVVQEHLSKLPKKITSKLHLDFGDSPLNHSFVSVCREKGFILFTENAGDIEENNYKGELFIDERFTKFGINKDKTYTTFELADFIKMNRSFFETKDTAMKIVSELRSFKAKVDRQIENSDDKRGNRRLLAAQVVQSNIPESFRINVPIFSGFPKQTIEIEISIDATDFSCKLISPEANDYIETVKDELINNEIEAIKKLHPALRIFEI